MTMITHLVEYSYWFTDLDMSRSSDDGFRECTSLAEAEELAAEFRKLKDVVADSVKIVELAEPYVSESDFED